MKRVSGRCRGAILVRSAENRALQCFGQGLEETGRLTRGDISVDLAAVSELLEKRLDEVLRLVSLETIWMPTNEDDTLVKQPLTLVVIHDI